MGGGYCATLGVLCKMLMTSFLKTTQNLQTDSGSGGFRLSADESSERGGSMHTDIVLFFVAHRKFSLKHKIYKEL